MTAESYARVRATAGRSDGISPDEAAQGRSAKRPNGSRPRRQDQDHQKGAADAPSSGARAGAAREVTHGAASQVESSAPDQTPDQGPVQAAASPETPKTVPFPDGLDARVIAAVEATGIATLYPPQAEAVRAVLAGRNVVVSIPTASGKSLIAHMAIFHRLLTGGGKALFIVPLRALASEKYEELRELATHIAATKDGESLRVAIATGDLDEADTRLGTYDIIVTTSEKADSLMRHRAGWIDALRCVVTDEIHLLGDSYRGPTLEVLLARMRALNRNAQIIGLSATIGNAREIADWLDAELVTSTWRPVRLKEGVLLEDMITFDDGTIRAVPPGRDNVVRLALQTIEDGGAVLCFVNTRRSTEAVALRLAPKVKNTLSEVDLTALAEAAARLREEDGETSALGNKLADAIERGAAFHNAGLSSSQRRTVEGLFRAGHIKTIVATPTLAAGVNLPARRVILRDHTRYEASLGMSAPLPVMEVKQMTGRAGRPRYDPWGEAVLIAKDEDAQATLFETYLRGQPESIRSKLGNPAALRIHLLSGIATGLTVTRDEIMRFIDSSFLAHDPAYASRWQLQDQVDDVVRFLLDQGFIEANADPTVAGGERLEPTFFGKATSDLYIDPESSLILRNGLRVADQRLEAGKTVSPLAVLTLVAATPDVLPLWLRKQDEWVEMVADEHTGTWLQDQYAAGRDAEAFLAEVKTGLLLQDWIDEKALDEMEAKYGLGPGDIHNRVQRAEWLLHAAEAFARMDRLLMMKQVNHIKRRVHHGCREDLLKIVALKGVGRYRARTLAAAGFDTITKLQAAPASTLLRLKGFGPRIVQNLLKQLDRDEGLDALQREERRIRKDDGPDDAGYVEGATKTVKKAKKAVDKRAIEATGAARQGDASDDAAATRATTPDQTPKKAARQGKRARRSTSSQADIRTFHRDHDGSEDEA